MNAEVKKLWIDDLRAHPELQGRGTMMDAYGAMKEYQRFCCLGRLCQLAVDAGEFSWSYFRENNLSLVTGYLPAPVVAWAGLDDRRPEAEGVTLENHNDNGKSFPQIADLIERYL